MARGPALSERQILTPTWMQPVKEGPLLTVEQGLMAGPVVCYCPSSTDSHPPS